MTTTTTTTHTHYSHARLATQTPLTMADFAKISTMMPPTVVVAGMVAVSVQPAVGDLVGTTSSRLTNDTCVYSSSAAYDAFAFAVAPNRALVLRALGLVVDGALLTLAAIRVPTRGCVVGEFFDMDQCLACPAGTLSNISLASMCMPCADDFYTQPTNSSARL